MSNQYNVDDILNEIKAKKARQNKASARPSYRPEPRPARRPVAENIEDLSFEPSPAKPAESAKPKEENVLSFHSDVKPVSEAAPTREPETPVQTIPVSERPVQEHPAEGRTPEPTSRSASFSRPEPVSPDPMSSTGVFFSSLSSHRETVKTQEHEERERLERRRRELLEEKKRLEEEQLRIAREQASQKQAEPVDEITDSFFLEQQPADLPQNQSSTPFGDFEPVTPSPEQKEASMMKDKTEYQKFFVSQEEAPKQNTKPNTSQPSSEDAVFDTSSLNFDGESTQEDIFASTPTGLTEEFAAAQMFSSATKSQADSSSRASAKSSKSSQKHFHIDLPGDAEEEEDVPSEKQQSSQKQEKKGGIFGKKKAPAEEPKSRLASAEVPVPEDISEEEEELEDYSSPKDKEAILRDMKSIKTGLLVRVVLMVVLFSLSLYLALAARDIQIGDELLPLPTFIQPELHLRTYMVVSCILSAIGAVICSNTIGGGLLALLKFRANTDTLPMLALLGTLAQGICFIIKPEYFSVDKADFGSNLYLFFPVALFILLFNLLGKILVILRIQNNFKLVSSEKLKHAAVFLKDRNLLRDISKGLSMEEYTIAYPETSPFLANFLDNSYSEDHAERMSRVLAPICLLAGIVLAVLAYLFNKNIAEAVSTFTAIMCVSAPLTSTIAANLPLYRMSKKLIPAGAMVSGYSAVDAFSRTEAVILDAKDLFRPSDIILHGIKPFDQSKIDSVILDAASVVCNTDGMLTDVFNKIIGSNKAMLRPVENVTYEDAMGLSAWVDGKRVLIGNRELMVNHGIEVPSNDYEMRFVKDRKNIIYLSNSGQLSAMFVISYRPNNQTREHLDRMNEKGMSLIINTSDPNITAEKIHAVYDFPLDQIKLMPAKFHAAYEELTAQKEHSPAKIGFIGSTRMMVTAILDCMTAKTAIDQAVLIQMIALVVGYALVTLFSLMGNLSYLSILHLILFQGIFALIGTLIPNLKKY